MIFMKWLFASKIPLFFLRLSVGIVLLHFSGGWIYAQAPFHLQRQVDSLPEVSVPLSSETAHYQAMFGAGDRNSQVPKGVTRYGQLILDPHGASRAGAHKGEELVYYVLEGTGTLGYAGREVPVSSEDFFYVPAGVDHRLVNPREAPLRLIVMGFVVDELSGAQTPPLQIANAGDVTSQILAEGHGPTSSYQLLLGATDSERDRIAAGRRVTSLYIITFEPGGTNNVHSHRGEEEIYFMLQGSGEMVAGDSDGEPARYPAKSGDGFFFTRNSPVGFFSDSTQAQPHARILAVRSIYPDGD